MSRSVKNNFKNNHNQVSSPHPSSKAVQQQKLSSLDGCSPSMVCRNARGRIPAAPDPQQTPVQSPVPATPSPGTSGRNIPTAAAKLCTALVKTYGQTAHLKSSTSPFCPPVMLLV